MKIRINHQYYDGTSKTSLCEDCFIKSDGNHDKAKKKMAKDEGDKRAMQWLSNFTANYKDSIKEDSEIKCMCGNTLFKVIC